MGQPLMDSTENKSAAERVTQEYEDFAYIVSHDLNAPLRHIKEFSRLLVSARAGNLSEEEQECISYLEKSLSMIDDMQRALLSFSRINTRAGPVVEIDTGEIVKSALADRKEGGAGENAMIEFSNLPVIHADKKQVRLLFECLLDNALKFHKPGCEAKRISITAEDGAKECLFRISDNGIGMPTDFQEDVFRLFRRLEPDKYPGIGAGLALARQIVRRHNGKIYIRSVPDRGTSVFFSLPK